MTQTVIFIHGGNAYSDYDAFLDDLRTMPLRELPDQVRQARWTDTLAADLGDEYVVYMPKMPNAQNAKYEEWKIWFKRYLDLVDGEVILIGWSQGGYFLTKYLLEEDLTPSVSALYLLAAPFTTDDFGGEDGGDFAFATNRVGELAKKVGKITILHSTDDPVVPFSHALAYAAALPSATLVTCTDQNHFLVTALPVLLAEVRGYPAAR